MRIWVGLLAVAALLGSGRETVRSEPNPEKRSDKALDYATSVLVSIKKASDSGEAVDLPERMKEVREAVDLSVKSLDASGKNPSKSGYFKKAELKTRELVRRLDNLGKSVGFEERGQVEELMRYVEKIHDDLLHRVMTKR